MANFLEYIEGVNSTIICVDIQKEYQQCFSFRMNEFARFINQSKRKIVFLFNGPDLGFSSEEEYKYWLMEYGISENKILRSTFYDKGYAFFRYPMDSGIDDDETINLVKFMMEKGVNDSRDLDQEFWDEFVSKYKHNSIRELLQHSGDLIHIPDLMQFLRPFNSISLCGGGRNECLKEVEIALKVLNKNFNFIQQFVY